MATRGYSSYHGRRSGRRIIAVAALLAVFLLAAGYLAAQNFVVYESDGSVRLEIPFLHRDSAPTEEEIDPAELPRVEILSGEEKPAEPEEAVFAVRGRRIAGDVLCEKPETVYRQLSEEGCTSILVPVKTDNGVFRYTTELARTKATDAAAVSQTLLRTSLEQVPLHRIAELSCFHDSFFAFSDMAGSGICQSNGYIWYDERSSYWLDPAKEGTREYLCAVAQECAAMGFDELLLTEFTYPTRGKLSQIDYSAMPMGKAEALELFVTELRAAVGPELALSAVLREEEILAGGDSVSGVEVARLLPLVDRIYVSAADKEAVLAALEAAGAEDASALTVWIEGEAVSSALAESE